MKKLLAIGILGVMVLTIGACRKQAALDAWEEPTTLETGIEENEEADEGAESEEEIIGMENPFIEYETIEEAKEHISFDVEVPDTIDGYDEENISIMDDKMFQKIYRNADSEICIRKQEGSGDISGDYNKYEEENAVDVNGIEVVMRGNDGYVRNVTWTNDGFAYSIYTDADMTEEDMVNLVNQIK